MFVSTLGLEKKYFDELLSAFPEYEIIQTKDFSSLLPEQLMSVKAVFTYGYDIKEDVLQKMPNLEWIHVGQSGVDGMDRDAVCSRKIHVTNSRGINSITIAEYVLSMMLNMIRNNYVFYNSQLNCEWNMDTHLDELYEKTVGIFGLGKAGQEVAKRCKAFGMKVVGIDIFRTDLPFVDEFYYPDQMEKLLSQSDFVVINMPLTEKTRGIINSETLAMMKQSAVLINCGRGEIVVAGDLVSALERKTIAGAVLDVFESEPLTPESPFWKMQNVIVTPHIAGDRQSSYIPRMMAIMKNNISVYPDFPNMVNPVKMENGF